MSGALVLPGSIEVEQHAPTSDLALSARLTIGLFPMRQWLTENPEAAPGSCPEAFLEIRIGILAAETHPLLTAPPNEWPSAEIPVAELVRVPWRSWRKEMDKVFLPTSESDG